MSKTFGHAKFLSAIVGLSLVGYAGLGAANAASVSQAQSRPNNASRLRPDKCVISTTLLLYTS